MAEMARKVSIEVLGDSGTHPPSPLAAMAQWGRQRDVVLYGAVIEATLPSEFGPN